MTGLFIASILGGLAMLYFANSLLQKRSSNVVSLKLQSAEVEAQLSAYQQAKKDVEKYSYLEEIINSALPQDKDQARTVREIFALAKQSGITIKSIQFPSSTLGGVTVTQAKIVEGLKGVYSIETVVTPYADGEQYIVKYSQLIDFLSKIESNRRAMQVASIQLNPLGQSSTDSISFTLTLNIFIKP